MFEASSATASTFSSDILLAGVRPGCEAAAVIFSTSTVTLHECAWKKASVDCCLTAPLPTSGWWTPLRSSSVAASLATRSISSSTVAPGLLRQNATAAAPYSSTSPDWRSSSGGRRNSTARFRARSCGVAFDGTSMSLAGAAPMTLAWPARCGSSAATARARSPRSLGSDFSPLTQSVKPSSA